MYRIGTYLSWFTDRVPSDRQAHPLWIIETLVVLEIILVQFWNLILFSDDISSSFPSWKPVLRNGYFSKCVVIFVRSSFLLECDTELLTYLLIYLLTYLLTPCSRVLLQKLTGFQLVKKFPAFYGTRRFITAFTSVRYLSLFWARSIQSMSPHPNSWRSSHLRLCLPSGLFPSDFPTKPCVSISSPHTRYMPHPSHSSRFDRPNNIW